MKVRITRMYFDGMRRHREGSVITIPDTKYTKQSEIPKTSKKSVGDYIHFAKSCMEIVPERTRLVDVPRPVIGPHTVKSAVPSVETSEPSGEQSPANESVI